MAVEDNTSPERRPRGQDTKNAPSSPPPVPGAEDGSHPVDRGRSRVRRASNSETEMDRKGYHSLRSSFGKTFHVKKRWKLIREMGSGDSAGDEITGETVAIKLVSRVFDKIQLAKRALREITLLRHFTGHANITGLIDAKMISPEVTDLHQIIKSGQTLTNEHVQYFVYQILRGAKFIHSAGVIHRDLKPGNLLVNADCELKICDFGLSRGFENASHLTEYVATRWYRAPEIMLGFREYDTAIDVWSIGCILAELLSSQPLFKGKDYVNRHLRFPSVKDQLGSPEETVLQKIASEKARTYVRSLPISKKRPFTRILPTADPQAIELLTHMVTFDPDQRYTVAVALEHPWLSGYHEPEEEPDCPDVYEKWKAIEELETLDDFRAALWNEIQDYRKEIRGGVDDDDEFFPTEEPEEILDASVPDATVVVEEEKAEPLADTTSTEQSSSLKTDSVDNAEALAPHAPSDKQFPTPTDPVATYARRSSIMQPTRQGSIYGSPRPASQHLQSFTESPRTAEPAAISGGIVFPTQQGYVMPARSRTGSMAGRGEVTRKLLRTLSTVSIHESAEGRAGGLAEIAPIGRYIVESNRSEADAPPSEMPRILEDEERKPKKEGGFFI
ncbi:kinase-like protein [Roridomyces roridus]|uniref:Kinase-like protein n=1 Tax=Roridomyces roridus TaxID=1738132 RepID=A0AAD7FGQ0_9AGAR|nr:kinase-like protein [Roridomyces roridus]